MTFCRNLLPSSPNLVSSLEEPSELDRLLERPRTESFGSGVGAGGVGRGLASLQGRWVLVGKHEAFQTPEMNLCNLSVSSTSFQVHLGQNNKNRT